MKNKMIKNKITAGKNRAAKKQKNKKNRESVTALKLTGRLSKTRKGFGFIAVTDEESKPGEDIYVSAADMAGAMEGDLVEAVLLPHYKWRGTRPEAEVINVIERATEEVVGVFIKSKRYGYVMPSGKKLTEDVFIANKDSSGAASGDTVVAKIIRYPGPNSSAEGRITEIIARRGEAGADLKALIRSAGFRSTFPSRAAAQAKAIGRAGVVLNQNSHRRDLRDKTIVTIDGRDSKDFDDAVSVERLPNGNYLLGVHIADVSEYVTENSPLDKEALKRGTSVYVMNCVVPMLPVELSNDVCSLNPHVDRLTLSVNMEITPEGKTVDYEIYESVIRSSARLVYDDVSDIIENDDAELKEKYADIYPDICAMAELASILSAVRDARGNLDFDFDEAHITLGEDGIPLSVDISARRTANRLIEEFMLLANETIAKHFALKEVPFVYRVHERPSEDKLEALALFLSGFSIRLPLENTSLHPGVLADILRTVKDMPYENVISTVMLRSMQKAAYEVECKGHFGLALKYYCHFTSPIRRYPDLIIHRIIKEYLRNGGFDRGRTAALKKATEEAAELSSINERKALDLERDAEKMKKAEYMSYHIGEIYDGVISGVSNYGIYVQLPNTVEGMVRLENIPGDYYDYEPTKYRVIGRRTNNIYTLGQSVTIKVLRASAEDREIDFELVSN